MALVAAVAPVAPVAAGAAQTGLDEKCTRYAIGKVRPRQLAPGATNQRRDKLLLPAVGPHGPGPSVSVICWSCPVRRTRNK